LLIICVQNLFWVSPESLGHFQTQIGRKYHLVKGTRQSLSRVIIPTSLIPLSMSQN
jgi:hypothetical protein